MEHVHSKLCSDRISNLPDNVTDIIISCLPTRDAVRTSILSRNWRHVWTKLPKFVLDRTLWKNVSEHRSAETILTKILCHIFSRHDGPIKEFVLSNPDLECCPEIDDLIFFLAKNHIEEFTLEMWRDCYSLPGSIFLCRKLSQLRLRLCLIRNWPTYEVFGMLTTLLLIEVTMSAKTLASLISGCPLLASLEMESCPEVDICIDAPNLKSFVFFGDTKSINFKRVPLLSCVSIIHEDSNTITFEGVGCDIIKFFHLLPVIESLELDYVSIQGFEGILPRGLPTPLIYLKELELCLIGFNDIDQLSFTLCLLRSSPNLKSIYIKFENYNGSSLEEIPELMKGEYYSDILSRGLPTPLIYLNDLSLFQMSFNVIGELSFTLCLLRSSPNLEVIRIQFEDYPVSNLKESSICTEGEDCSDICLNELLEVVLEGVTGTKPELEFIRLLLAKSSSLRKLKIKPLKHGVDDGSKIVKEVLKFQRASKEAEIIFEE